MTILVYVLIILFGSSTWLCVTGVWVESPLMISIFHAPEEWTLPSYLAILVQVAIVGPIAYSLFKKLAPSKYASRSDLHIYGYMTLATSAIFLMAFFWQSRTYAMGNERSVALFALTFFISLVSSTSSVLYLPYMHKYQPKYITAYFIGMGISAVVPSALAVIQGAGRVVCDPVYNNITLMGLNLTVNLENKTTNFDESHKILGYEPRTIYPYFSITVFYLLICGWMCLTTFAFWLLNRPNISAYAIVPRYSSERRKEIELAHSGGPTPAEVAIKDELGVSFCTRTNVLLLMLTFWACALQNGILLSIQTFSCLPYGHKVYHLANVLSNIANPLGSFIAYFHQLKRWTIIVVFTIVMILSSYLMFLAVSSPTPIFGRTILGSVLCVSAWILVVVLLQYLRTVCGSLLRQEGNENTLWWCGICNEAGSFLGSVIMFPLANNSNYFRPAPQCP